MRRQVMEFQGSIMWVSGTTLCPVTDQKVTIELKALKLLRDKRKVVGEPAQTGCDHLGVCHEKPECLLRLPNTTVDYCVITE